MPGDATGDFSELVLGLCAGALLVAEAGGMVTDPDGRAIRFNNRDTLLPGLIASNQVLHRSILNMIRVVRASME